MSSEWTVSSLLEHYEVRSGLSKPAKAFGSGYPFLTFKDVFYNYFAPEKLGDLVQSTQADRNACSVRRGDVFLTRTSETMHELGMSCVALKDFPEATFNGFCKRLRPKSDSALVPEYVGYFLRSPTFRQSVTAMSTMSTRASLNNEIIGRLTISYPPRKTQKQISSILKSLDDRITLLRETNATLEAIAQALFKSWFVDFDPVRAKQQGQMPEGMDEATAALFPENFEESQMGLIPEGWKFDTIKNHTSSIQYGFTQSATTEPIGPHFLRITDIRDSKINWQSVPFCKATDEETKKYRVMDGDIFVARTGASTGENIYVVEPPSAVFASYLIRIQFASRGIGRIVGEFMRTVEYKNYVTGMIGGSAQPNANAQTLASASMVFPSEKIACMFYEQIRPLDMKKAANGYMIQTLASLRDTLLPRLISGQLRVTEAEDVVEEVTA